MQQLPLLRDGHAGDHADGRIHPKVPAEEAQHPASVLERVEVPEIQEGEEMTELIGSRICGGNTAYKRRASDFYPTPPEATQALLDFLKLPEGTTIWEPACGEGHMVEVFEKNGYMTRATDLTTGIDFLTTTCNEADWIITNPPFSLSEQFIRKCAQYGVPFALLLKSQYWHATRRTSLFFEFRPAYVLPLTWRPDFLFKTRGSGSPLMDVLWCVWFPGANKTEYVPLAKPGLLESGT